MLNDKITLHPKYGVNPTIRMCFFCQKETGEIVLLGAAYKEEAPPHMVIDYEPCENCQAEFDKGILLVEANEDAQHNPIPTGNYWVITEESATKVFEGPLQQQVLESRRAFISKESATYIGLYD